MSVVLPAHVDSLLCGLREGHARASALPRDALVGHFEVLRTPAERLSRNLLQLLDRIRRRCVRRTCRGVNGLASSRDARPWQVARRIAPDKLALLPRHAQHL